MSSRNDARLPYPKDDGYQAVSFTASSARTSAGVGEQTRQVVLYADQDCHIAYGDSAVTATTSDFFLPASVVMFLQIRPGQYVAAIRSSADGTLHVSETTY